MNIVAWLSSFQSDHSKALSFYKRGMAKAIKRDHQGAIDDYTAAISVIKAPADVKAMSLYNRALAYVAKGDDQLGLNDLAAVLAFDETLVNIKTMAKHKLARMEARGRRGNR